MRRAFAVYWFGLGVLATGLVILVGGYFFLRLGFVNPRADVPVNQAEKGLMGPAMDASVNRRAGIGADPLPPTPSHLANGLRLYAAHCAQCHGEQKHPHAELEDSLYPRAPQFFLDDPPEMTAAANFYIVEHGIRNTGMPAWGPVLNPTQMWELVAYLSQVAENHQGGGMQP